jgi:hypothetical protein
MLLVGQLGQSIARLGGATRHVSHLLSSNQMFVPPKPRRKQSSHLHQRSLSILLHFIRARLICARLTISVPIRVGPAASSWRVMVIGYYANLRYPVSVKRWSPDTISICICSTGAFDAQLRGVLKYEGSRRMQWSSLLAPITLSRTLPLHLGRIMSFSSIIFFALGLGTVLAQPVPAFAPETGSSVPQVGSCGGIHSNCS